MTSDVVNTVFENERYIVVREYDGDHAVRSAGYDYYNAYNVVNKSTGVNEYRVPQLPEAISIAEQLDMAMEQKPWEWARRAHEAQMADVNPDGSPIEDDEDPEVH